MYSSIFKDGYIEVSGHAVFGQDQNCNDFWSCSARHCHGGFSFNSTHVSKGKRTHPGCRISSSAKIAQQRRRRNGKTSSRQQHRNHRVFLFLFRRGKRADSIKRPQILAALPFWFFFYNFGLFAWGGPVAQIALIKDKLVIKDKWISLARFQRVFAVYQILPGPEAAELCMFFGCLSAGRIGGIVAGLAFILPGFILMLVASYLYYLAGVENKYFNASFRALQPIVAAMVSQSKAH